MKQNYRCNDYLLCSRAIQICPYAIKFVDSNMSDDEYNKLVWLAIENDRSGFILKSMIKDKLSRAVYIEAVKKYGKALQYVPLHMMDYQMCEIAIENSPSAIKYVPDQYIDEKLCILSMQKWQSIKYINERCTTYAVVERLFESYPELIKFHYKNYNRQLSSIFPVKPNQYNKKYLNMIHISHLIHNYIDADILNKIIAKSPRQILNIIKFAINIPDTSMNNYCETAIMFNNIANRRNLMRSYTVETPDYHIYDKLPDKYKTKKLTLIAVSHGCVNIPSNLFSDEVYKKIIHKSTNYNILTTIESHVTQDLCDVYFDRFAALGCFSCFNLIPLKYKTREMILIVVRNGMYAGIPLNLLDYEFCKEIIHNSTNYNILTTIHSHLTQDLCDMYFNKFMMRKQFECFNLIPNGYKSKELCEAAFEYSHKMYIKIPAEHQTCEMAKIAILSSDIYIPHLNPAHRPSEILMSSVQINWQSLHLLTIEEQTEDICSEALKQNEQALQFIKIPLTNNMKYNLVQYWNTNNRPIINKHTNEECLVCRCNSDYYYEVCTKLHMVCFECIVELHKSNIHKCLCCMASYNIKQLQVYSNIDA